MRQVSLLTVGREPGHLRLALEATAHGSAGVPVHSMWVRVTELAVEAARWHVLA